MISNQGNAGVSRPFKVPIGVTIDWPPAGPGGTVRSQQEIFTIDQTLPPGVVAETPESSAPLVYFDEEGARYQFDMLVDINNEITEVGGASNSLTWDGYWFVSVNAMAADSFRIGDIAAELKAEP